MNFQIPIGPQHPALKEPISLRMTVDGEVITDADIRLGYNHRGLEKLAEDGDASRFTLPRALLGRDGYDFSFSGLKTAAARLAELADWIVLRSR